jgi:hypothetical protein
MVVGAIIAGLLILALLLETISSSPQPQESETADATPDPAIVPQ